MLTAAIETVGQGSGGALPPSDRPDALVDDVRNLEQTAQFFGVSVPTVRGWIAEPCNPCPVVERGANGVAYKLSLRAVHAWRQGVVTSQAEEVQRRAEQDAQLRFDLLGPGALSGKVELGAGVLTPKQRGEAIQAELAAVRLAQQRRELVQADGMQIALASAFTRIGMTIRSLPERLQRELGLADRDAVVMSAAVDDVLGALADELEDLKPENLAAVNAD